jgi:two-component system NtrC family response regulator
MIAARGGRAAAPSSHRQKQTRVVLIEGSARETLAPELAAADPDVSLECVLVSGEPDLEEISESIGGCDVVVADASSLIEARASNLLPRVVGSVARLEPSLHVLAVCARGDDAAAREAAAAGAWDVLELGSSAVGARLRDAAHLHRLASRPIAGEPGTARSPREAAGRPAELQRLLGSSDAMCELVSLIERVAESDVPVLLTGESGTGKEVTARALHALSPRHAGPFVPINCGAIPEDLLESELFGHERGAFTGAVRSRRGRFEGAHGGTLFLDEIGELRPHLQVKLLRFLEDHVIEPVGGNERRVLDVRVLAATNRDLLRAVETGAFREDLYYRLAVFKLHLPPLRERGEDVLQIASALLEQAAAETGRRVYGFTPAALDALRKAPWPGNVRELINRIRRAVVVADGPRIEPADLGLEATGGEEPGLRLREARSRAEVTAVLAALRRSGWNKSEAARRLDISRTQLYEILHRHHISNEG